MTDTETSDQMHADDVAAIDELRQSYEQMCAELGKIIVGQQAVIEQLAICLFARGHALLMGVPGLAKTLMIRCLSETMDLSFSRIQFTPDLMPMDITGTDILQESGTGRREFEFARGQGPGRLVRKLYGAPGRCGGRGPAGVDASRDHLIRRRIRGDQQLADRSTPGR